MPSTPDYEDLYTYRKRSVLPPDAQTAAYELGQAIENNNITSAKISMFRESLTNIPASAVPRASAEIREIARIYQGYHQPQQPTGLLSKFLKPLKPKISAIDALHAYPDTGWLLIFHGNGYVRQAALEALASTPHSEFEFSAIVYRLNDWVENIRSAAARYAQSFFPKSHPAIVGKSAFFLLAQARVLSRWNRDGKDILENTIYRTDVLEYLKAEFLRVRSGRAGHTLQQILKRSDFDLHLSELANNAALPSIRAVAMDALLNKRARWFVGYTKQWIDKVFGISRRVADFETRSVDLLVDFDSLLVAAASDRSAHVRKIAADVLNANLSSATEQMDKIAKTLQNDKNSSVRARVDFYMRKRDNKGVLRFFFEYGAGGCLWAGNPETTERLGYGPVDAANYNKYGEISVEPSLRLSDEAIKLRDKLDFEHSGYLNPKYPPDPSLWTQALCDRFNGDVETLIALIRKELSNDYEILDQQDRYSEDPDLVSYLAENLDLEPIDTVSKPTVRTQHD